SKEHTEAPQSLHTQIIIIRAFVEVSPIKEVSLTKKVYLCKKWNFNQILEDRLTMSPRGATLRSRKSLSFGLPRISANFSLCPYSSSPTTKRGGLPEIDGLEERVSRELNLEFPFLRKPQPRILVSN
ncbi:5'-3' exonuclease family protein, partial [Striga asiatica]